VSPADLLVRLFHEEAPRVFDAQPVEFGCTCSEAKVRESLSIYSTATSPHDHREGIVTADCQFCGAHYRLDPATLGQSAETPDDDG
jgi:molecular chaperone Hsp33